MARQTNKVVLNEEIISKTLKKEDKTGYAEASEIIKKALKKIAHVFAKFSIISLPAYIATVIGYIYTPIASHDSRGYRDWETDRKSTRLNSSH